MQEKGGEREITFLTIYEGKKPSDWSLSFLALGVQRWYCWVVVGRVGLGAKERLSTELCGWISMEKNI